MRPDGNCRACMVEIKGERVLAPSCCRKPTAGMEVTSDSPRAVHSQKIIVEMLAADVPARVYKLDSELEQWKRWLGIGAPRFAARAQPKADLSHPAIAVNLDACIQCTRCVRACREEQVNDVIGYAFRGAHSAIVFDLGDPMGVSTCVACGECVQACPTGALAPANDAYLVVADKVVPSVCPYCGVGCQLDYHVKDNEIVRVEGRDGPANHERLVRQGALWLRLRASPPAADQAADPQARLRQDGRFRHGPGRSARGVSRGELGRGAAGGRWHAQAHPRRARRQGARRLRLGQGLERGSVSVPEAGAHRFRLEQRRPLHAALPRVERRGAARRHRVRRGVESGDGRDEGRGRAADRRQPGGQSSGRRDLDQERGQERHQADPRRSAPLRARAARDALPAVQAGHRRRAAERDDARRSSRKAWSRRASSPTAPAASRRSGRMSPATVPRRWRRYAAFRRRRSARSRECTRRRAAR